jgi:hypothetical protein
MKLHKLLPWQLALLHDLGITLLQHALEGGRLRDYLLRIPAFRPRERHEGVYVTPRRYKTDGKPRAMQGVPVAYHFSLLSAAEGQERHFISHVLGEMGSGKAEAFQPPWSSAMRVARARPLVHLSLRISHADWWTWTDVPESADELHHLGLDPTVGDGSASTVHRPTAARMRALADQRRAGNHPEIVPGIGWATIIEQLPDLKRLELVLETFSGKRKQLDNVVEAAKMWVFPISGTRYELSWDGEIEMVSNPPHRSVALPFSVLLHYFTKPSNYHNSLKARRRT